MGKGICIQTVKSGLHKSVYWKIIFFISHPKHMLWVLKRHVKKLMGKKIIKILRK